MAIYNRWGSEVRISAYHGKHKPKWANFPMMLVSVHYLAENVTGFQFVSALRATDGINEIEAAIDKLPETSLDEKSLKMALKEAE